MRDEEMVEAASKNDAKSIRRLLKDPFIRHPILEHRALRYATSGGHIDAVIALLIDDRTDPGPGLAHLAMVACDCACKPSEEVRRRQVGIREILENDRRAVPATDAVRCGQWINRPPVVSGRTWQA